MRVGLPAEAVRFGVFVILEDLVGDVPAHFGVHGDLGQAGLELLVHMEE